MHAFGSVSLFNVEKHIEQRCRLHSKSSFIIWSVNKLLQFNMKS